MTKDPDTSQTDDAAAAPENIHDEALEQAEGGFSLSGTFTQTTSTFTQTNFQTTSTDTTTALEDVDTVAALRRRPGRIGWPGGF